MSQPQDSQRELALQQLRFHQERIAEGSEVVSAIMQNIFWAFGVGVLAATRFPEAISAIPVFWSAWMLHALQRSRDTRKHEIYARALEDKLGKDCGSRILLWNSVLTSDKLGKVPRVEHLNTGYWILLNAGSWLGPAGYFFIKGNVLLGWVLVGGFIAVYSAAGLYRAANRNFEMKCKELVEEELEKQWDGAQWSKRKLPDEG